MKSVVELDIDVRQAKLAKLFADPNNNPQWMDEIERIEPVSGKLGEPGSVYRLVPKRGKLNFIATVISRELPSEARLSLEDRSVAVSVRASFQKLSDRKTRLISEETFRFKGLMNRLLGLFAHGAIRAAHRRHMESFKRFAESQAS
jgi:hypothetical protein